MTLTQVSGHHIAARYHACASMLDVRPVRREGGRRSVRAREARTMTTEFPPATATKNAIPVR
jgi:hypothetical protein